MYEAVVTFVMMSEGGAVDNVEPYPYTKVYRLEFDTKEDFDEWIGSSDRIYKAINVEQLSASPRT